MHLFSFARPAHHNMIDHLHSFDGSVFFHGVKKRDIGEGEVGFHVFESHSSSRMFNLQEIWHKKTIKSS